jgi:hypothetical protein
LKRQIRALQCELVEEVNIPENEYNPCLVGTPCWMETDGYGDSIPIDDRCEACQEAWLLVERRREIGAKIPGLAAKMYAAYRWEVGGLDD